MIVSPAEAQLVATLVCSASSTFGWAQMKRNKSDRPILSFLHTDFLKIPHVGPRRRPLPTPPLWEILDPPTGQCHR